MKSACYSDADCAEGKQCEIGVGKTAGVCVAMCFDDGDCPSGYSCEPVSSKCVPPDCWIDADCKTGFKCEDGRCLAPSSLQCPEGMAAVDQQFCIDVYEASRPDATEESAGEDGSQATSRVGVLPWRVVDNAEADAACRAADKRLCTESEWYRACAGPGGKVYSYGDSYDPTICNGIDTFCYCEAETCNSSDTCPFPHCYQSCGAAFHLLPTGSFPDCTNDFGLFDMNGNVWEHVQGGDETRIRGGAYNCSDSEQLHRCDYIPGNWKPSARGFRCCADGWVDHDAGADNGGNE